MRRLPPFQNGVRVVLNRYPSPSVAVRVVFEGGSTDDPPDVPGLHHALEHVLRRSTKKSPTTKELNLRVDTTSPVWNGDTDRLMVSFYGQTIPKKLVPLIKLLAEVALDPNITEEPVALERSRVRNERLEADESVDILIDEDFDRLSLGSSFGRPMDGPVNIVENYSVEALRRLHRRLVVGQKTIIIVSGNFDPVVAEQTLRHEFECMRAGQPRQKKISFPAVRSSIRLRIDDSKEQVYLILGWPTQSYDSPDRYADHVLRNYLSSRDSSQIKDTIDFQGKGYSSTDFLEYYPLIGQYGVRLVIDRDSFMQTLKTIATEVEKLCTQLISKEELAASHEHIALKTAEFFWDPFNPTKLFAEQLVTIGRLYSKQEYLREIKKVTRQRVLKAARRIFSQRRMILVAAGPIRGIKKQDIRSTLRFSRRKPRL